MFNIQEEEEMSFEFSTAGEVDRFDTELGAYNSDNTSSAWLLSDRDVWYRNPYYSGPEVHHPECECQGCGGDVESDYQPRTSAVDKPAPRVERDDTFNLF